MSPQVPSMLVRLAERGATGALLRDTGALYLADGAVVHAESPAAPGIDVLLTAGGRLPSEQWREAMDAAGPGCRIAGYLLDHGRLSSAELEIRHLSALYDAAYFVLSPDGGPTRFRHGARHWFGRTRTVGVADVERETTRRRRYLSDLWPHAHLDAVPPVRRPHVTRLPPVTRRQRDVLALADGQHTPARIAALLGRPAFHTLVDIRRLAASGHLETRIPPPGRDPASTAAVAPLAGAVAGATGGPRTLGVRRTPVPLPDFTDTVDVTVLRRLRDALEAHL